MRLELRVEHLERQYESLDGAVRDLLTITRNTHTMLVEHISDTQEFKSEVREDIADVREDIADVKADLKDFKAEVRGEFSQVRGDISELKELVIQSLSKP